MPGGRSSRGTGGSKRCPECGAEVGKPYRTWQLAAPFPDKKMRITITIMGMFQCPRCGKRFRAVVSKVKVGPEEIQVEKG